MKKTIKLGMVSVIAAAVLVGCGSSGGGSSEEAQGRVLVKSAIDSIATLQASLESLQGGVSDLENDAVNRGIINGITNNVIIGGYNALANQADALASALGNLKASPSAGTLSAAQNQWRATRVPWESGEGHIFGPVDTLSVDPKVDSWPVSKAELDGSLNGWTGGSVEGFPDEIRGFHAIEYILFGDGVETNTRDISTLTPTQLSYVHALGVSMAGQMRHLANAWTVGVDGAAAYKGTFTSLSVAATSEELLGGLIGIADEVGNGKMGDPYNEKDTTLVESQFSWNSTTDFANNITSIRNVWGAGMGTLMGQIDAQIATKITNEINDAISKIVKISDVDGDGIIDPDVKDVAFRNQILK